MSEQEQEQKYEPLSESDIEHWDVWLRKYPKTEVDNDIALKMIATIRDLRGQVDENRRMRAAIAKVMEAYEAAPDRALTYDYFKDIMADTIVRG